MVAISLYRGNLHRVSDARRQWPMPPRSITIGQFRILTRKRHEFLARIAAQKTLNSNHNNDHHREMGVVNEEPHEGGHHHRHHQRELNNSEVYDAQPIKVEGESKEISDANVNANDEALDDDALKAPETATTNVKIEVNNKLDTDKGKRKIELEKKLQVLNGKKHQLVQILKQILNAEEEIQRRNAQAASLRTSIPLPPETTVDMGSATRHAPKLSVEVNFSGDITAESDATANNSDHGRQIPHMQSIPPSAVPLARFLQQNMFPTTPRSSLATIGHVQAPSNVSASNSGAVTSSPYRLASGHQGHHHSASLPPVSVHGSHFMTSSPSPAASGGSSSVFRDSRLTSSS